MLMRIWMTGHYRLARFIVVRFISVGTAPKIVTSGDDVVWEMLIILWQTLNDSQREREREREREERERERERGGLAAAFIKPNKAPLAHQYYTPALVHVHNHLLPPPVCV